MLQFATIVNRLGKTIPAVNIEIAAASEWADFTAGMWPSRNVETPEDVREWADRNDVVILRSDDPAAVKDARTDWESLYTFHTPNARKADLREILATAPKGWDKV